MYTFAFLLRILRKQALFEKGAAQFGKKIGPLESMSYSFFAVSGLGSMSYEECVKRLTFLQNSIGDPRGDSKVL